MLFQVVHNKECILWETDQMWYPNTKGALPKMTITPLPSETGQGLYRRPSQDDIPLSSKNYSIHNILITESDICAATTLLHLQSPKSDLLCFPSCPLQDMVTSLGGQPKTTSPGLQAAQGHRLLLPPTATVWKAPPAESCHTVDRVKRALWSGHWTESWELFEVGSGQSIRGSMPAGLTLDRVQWIVDSELWTVNSEQLGLESRLPSVSLVGGETACGVSVIWWTECRVQCAELVWKV